MNAASQSFGGGQVGSAAAGGGGGGGAKGRNRLAILGGYADQGFAVPQSNFDHFDNYYYGLRFCRSWGRWNHGIEYSLLSGAKLNKFVLTNNEVGNYQINFSRIKLLIGFTHGRFASHLVVGYETVSWSGTPQLGAQDSAFTHYGLDFSYDYHMTASLRAPLMLTVLSHPERQFKFANYLTDSLTVKPAMEFQLGTGLAFDF